MSITMVNNTQKSFVVVNKAIVMDKELSLRDRGMMLTLMSFPPTWDFSIVGLEKILPEGKEAINNSIKRLTEKNYIVREQMRDERGKFAGTKLYINPNPKESPITENPSAVKPTTVTPQAEKQPQINNKEIKTNQLKNKESITHSEEGYAKTIKAIKEQIEYDVIMIDRKNDISLLNYIVELMARTLMTEKAHIRIGGIEVPTAMVKAKLEKLSFLNVEFVIDRVKEVETKITDYDGYLLTCLYKAEEQEDMYWNNLVKQQSKGGC